MRYRNVIVKVGTNVLTAGTERLNPARILEIVRQLVKIREDGVDVMLVSSGAIAAGRERLGYPDLDRGIPAKQMLAAVGQSRLMHLYEQLFGIYGLVVAQVLLTRADLRDRRRYLNARDTLFALLRHRIVPIINENDAVATEEIRVGDNDNLSALTANLIAADLLVLLTDQPGLFTSDPRRDPAAELIPEVDEIDAGLWAAAGGSGSLRGTGGMITKLQAADLARQSGTTVVIAEGSRPNVLLDIIAGEHLGTIFRPGANAVDGYKRWILAEKVTGRLIADDGAVRALLHDGKSLLPVGIRRVDGEFERGAIVAVLDAEGREVARGASRYRAADIERIRGARSSEIEGRLGYSYGAEVVHRDDLVVLQTMRGQNR